MKIRGKVASGHPVVWLSLAIGSMTIGTGYRAHAAAPGAPPAIEVRVSLDRTAIWIADRVTYLVEITCGRGVDIVDDDLAREKLKLDGLEVIGGDATRETRADETTVHRFRYALTTYRVDRPALRIAPLTVRYSVKRPGQRREDAVPAGEVQVPGAVLAFRSALPDDADALALRDGRAGAARPVVYSVAQPLGVGLIVASVAPAVFVGVALVRRQRRRTVHKSARKVRQEERRSLVSVHDLDLDSADARREAFTRVNEIVRDHLRDVCGVAGPSLTPGEVGPALESGASRVPVETFAALLAVCETARYAPPGALPSAEACRDAIARAEQMLAVR